MPELAELKLTADYINKFRDKTFNGIWKNHIHKGDNIAAPFAEFRVEARSRGKELLVDLIDRNNNTESIRFNMGMSGHFKWLQWNEKHKHAHLKFTTDDGDLCFIDVRRFGSWKLASGWSTNRGPDPTFEFDNFKENIIKDLHTRAFQKPICEVLMNQKYFNGIGNYLRAEILYRVDIDPMMKACEAILDYPEILVLCNVLPLEAYRLGGGQLKDWKNPFGEFNNSWQEFMKCYGNPNMLKEKDSNGRTIWFHPKWKNIKV